MSFSEPAANPYARMTATVVDGGFDRAEDPMRGEVSLDSYVGVLAGEQPHDEAQAARSI